MVLRILIGAAAAASAISVFAGDTIPVSPSLWDRPRSGEIVRKLPEVRQAVDAYLTQPGTRLIIHHTAGQEPQLQAEELRAWLVALAISGERVVLKNDLTPGDPLKIEVVR